ncbi:hypothetical protein OROHE_015667 [Orobanche hederae]
MDRERTPKFMSKSLHLLLPHHIIEQEILWRLPVKSLFQFKCVSKSWRSLIDSKPFIKSHLQNSSRNTASPHRHLILYCRKGIRINKFSPQSMLDGWIHPTPLNDPNINQLKYLRIVGCLNGLVCIVYNYRSFAFWNPSTKNFKKLPQSHDEASSCWCILNHGFGWDESSDDYKVFAFVYVYMHSEEEVIRKVYSSRTNSWKTVEHMDLQLQQNRGYTEGIFVAVGGKLHWNRDEGEIYIGCFDLKTEVWGKMKLPYEYKTTGSDFYSMVGVFDGCLSSIKFYYFECPMVEVWVMKEYGVQESWSKLIALSHFQEHVQRPLSAKYAVGRDGEVLLFFGMFFLIYYPRHNEFRRLPQFDGYVYQQNICVESLVWPQVV